ncbi:hypothetical protein EMIT0196P_90206 [Pseudomonas chlororaphis]
MGRSLPTVFRLGLGRGGAVADQRRWPDPPAVQRLRDRAALCAGDDGPVCGDDRAVYPDPVVAVASVASGGGGRGLADRGHDPGQYSEIGGDQSDHWPAAGSCGGGPADVLKADAGKSIAGKPDRRPLAPTEAAARDRASITGAVP